MLTKKGRKIRNQQAMILNRDRIINQQQEKLLKQESLLRDIYVIASSNLYGTDGTAYLGKIKELAKVNNLS